MSVVESKKLNKSHLLVSIVNEKCPNCRKGNVYEKKEHFFTLPVMKDRCNVCAYYFDREPGYFLGAMYISYGLAVLQSVLTFLILNFFFPSIPTIWVVLIILSVILVFSLKNYKLSRIIYIHIFPY